MSSDVTQTAGRGPSFSGVGRATLDIAARIGGLFAAVIVVAIIFILDQSQLRQPQSRASPCCAR